MTTAQNEILINQKGFSLIEVVVVMAIMAMVGLGTVTLWRSAIENDQVNGIKMSLASLRTTMKGMLENPTAWSNTYTAVPWGNPLGIDCLRPNPTQANFCTHNFVSNNFRVRDADNNVYYNPGNINAGFDRNGSPCTAFDPATGNDACPYRYDLSATMTCPGNVASCLKPKVVILATFSKNPNTKTSVLDRINPEDYSFQIAKNNKINYEPVTLQYYTTSSFGPPFNASMDAACHGGLSNRARPLNRVLNDVGNNLVSAIPAGTTVNNFTLRAGFYDCEITAHMYDLPGGYTLTLNTTSGAPAISIVVGNGVTGSEASAVVNANVQFNIDTNRNFELRQRCPGSVWDGTRGWFRLGMPMPNYTDGTVLTQIRCVRHS